MLNKNNDSDRYVRISANIIGFTVLLFLAGCGTPLQQSWDNFNAYFNTFYNTQQYYDDGFERNQGQPQDINPVQAVRVFSPPTSGGLQEFEMAIETGASILRDHSDSKYVEPAIFIIGKSFFYRTEYFSALEKFQELQVLSEGEKEQESVFWQGKTYYQMEAFDEGIRFLESEIELIDDWDEAILADVHVLLAEFYVRQGNWTSAGDLIRNSVTHMTERDERARAWFLFGQILEEQEDYEQARTAYAQVNPSHRYYDLEFNALRKEAEMHRVTGEYDRALRLYQRLERSDKNIDVRPELMYEVARTHQLMGNIDRAYELYENLVSSQILSPTPETLAKTYFAMGEIYRINREDYESAAEYFELAASQNADRNRLPANFNARQLADSFGEFATVKQSIAEKDSLLWLGSLDRAEFDSVIAEIEAQKREQLEQEFRETERGVEETMLTDTTEESAVEAAEAAGHGFLNIDNPAMLASASMQFQSRWGERPLVDNWRRASAVSGAGLRRIVASDDQETVIEEPEALMVSAQDGPAVSMNLDAIPRTEEQRSELKKQREVQYYQLGNVFFLSLDMPDSAAVYYQKVIDTSFNDDLIPRALYSLTEIDILQGDIDRAESRAERLFREYGGSIYAERTAERLGIELERDESLILASTEESYSRLQSSDVEDHAARAEELRELAAQSRPEQRPHLLYESAKEYIKAARQHDPDIESAIQSWDLVLGEAEKNVEKFEADQDSAMAKLKDPELSDDERSDLQAIVDSTFHVGDLASKFPYEGAYWDSTRVVLAEIEEEHSGSSVMRSVSLLQQSLQKPELFTEPDEEEAPEPDVVVDDGEVLSCSNHPAGLQLAGGKESFLETVAYPQWAVDAAISGEITYRVTVSETGELMDFEQKSRMDRSGIPQAIEQALAAGVSFEMDSDPGQPVECMVTFSFQTDR